MTMTKRKKAEDQHRKPTNDYRLEAAAAAFAEQFLAQAEFDADGRANVCMDCMIRDAFIAGHKAAKLPGLPGGKALQ